MHTCRDAPASPAERARVDGCGFRLQETGAGIAGYGVHDERFARVPRPHGSKPKARPDAARRTCAGLGAQPRRLPPRLRAETSAHARALCTLAAALLLVLAGFACLSGPAEAQTQIWSAMLTSQNTGPSEGGCDNSGVAVVRCSNTGTLTDDDFNYGGVDYAFTRIEFMAGTPGRLSAGSPSSRRRTRVTRPSPTSTPRTRRSPTMAARPATRCPCASGRTPLRSA